MHGKLFHPFRILVLLFIITVLMAGCAQKVTTGAFTQVNRLESELQRGKSTKMDVRRVLGAPKGMGNAVLSPDLTPRAVWFYDDIEVTDARSVGSGVLEVSVRQQILLVYFKGEVFDGFMWFSNTGMAVAENPDGF